MNPETKKWVEKMRLEGDNFHPRSDISHAINIIESQEKRIEELEDAVRAMQSLTHCQGEGRINEI